MAKIDFSPSRHLHLSMNENIRPRYTKKVFSSFFQSEMYSLQQKPHFFPFHMLVEVKMCWSSFMKGWLKKLQSFLGFSLKAPLNELSMGQLILESLAKLEMSIKRGEPCFFINKHLAELPEEEREEFFRIIGVANKGDAVLPDQQLGRILFEDNPSHPSIKAALWARINYWKAHV